MPTTTKGLPYPSPANIPDVPGDIQRLAEALDPRLPGLKQGITTGAFTVNNSAVMTDDPAFRWTFPSGAAGFYRVELVTGYACSAAGADVQQAWRATGDVTFQSRFVLGAETATTSVAATLMAARPAATFTSAQIFGVIPTNNSHVREDLIVQVGGTGGYLQFQFAQAVATVADLVRFTNSFMVVTPLGT
jgi:hypothetical protein